LFRAKKRLIALLQDGSYGPFLPQLLIVCACRLIQEASGASNASVKPQNAGHKRAVLKLLIRRYGAPLREERPRLAAGA